LTRIATFTACDEIAQAGLGKLAFLGIYGGDLVIPQLPFLLPQLFFVVRLRSPISDPPKRFVIRIERPGKEPFILDQSAAVQALRKDAPPDSTFLDAQAVVRLAPFDFEAEGVVKVFVEDEIGENYAGGLRIKVGVHPEFRTPQIAQSAQLAVGHYNRLSGATQSIRQETATQLVEALSDFVSYSGLPTILPFPEADVRLILDSKRIHVFLPIPRDTDAYKVEVESADRFELCEVDHKDRLGFILRFEPSLPADAVFNYTLSEDEVGDSEDDVKVGKSKKRSRKAQTKRS
jgi:hypothetical protein